MYHSIFCSLVRKRARTIRKHHVSHANVLQIVACGRQMLASIETCGTPHRDVQHQITHSPSTTASRADIPVEKKGSI
jgi:hypothetical protein